MCADWVAMKKIASPQHLQAELGRLVSYCQGPDRPSRAVLASEIRGLATRVAGEDWLSSDRARGFAKDIATEIKRAGGQARATGGVIRADIETADGPFSGVRIEVFEGGSSQEPVINASFGSRGMPLPLGPGLGSLSWDARKIVKLLQDGIEWVLSHRR